MFPYLYIKQSLRIFLLIGIGFCFLMPQKTQAQLMRSMPIFAGYLGYPADFGPMPMVVDQAPMMRTAPSSDWDSFESDDSEALVASAEETVITPASAKSASVVTNSDQEGELVDWALNLDYEKADAKSDEWVPYTDKFTLKPEEEDGIQMTGVDPHGNLVIIEDRLLGKLSIRIQKIRVSHLELKWYNETGKLMFFKESVQLPIGTELAFNYMKWPQGTYTVMVRVDDGVWQERKVTKPKDGTRL